MSNVLTGTIPEPTEVLTANRTRTGKPLLPPPHARSPIKTSLGSSPRRSLGPMSSPRRNGDTPSRAMSHPLVNPGFDFSMEEARQSVERSPKKARSVITASSFVVRKGKLLQTSGKGRKRPFSLSLEDDEKEDDTGNISDTDLPVFTSQADVFDVPADDDESIPVNGDHGLEVPEDAQEEISEVLEQPKANIGAKKRGRKPKAAVVDDSPVLTKAETPADPPITKKRGRPPKQQIAGIDESQIVPIKEGEDIPATAEYEDVPQKKKRGPKKSKLDVHRDEEQQEVEAGSSKPTKRARHGSVGASHTKAARKGQKPPPSERDPNARVTTAKGKGKASSIEPTSSSGFGKHKPRSLYVLRHETPAEDDGSRLLRSGRTSVKPIAYWRGERIVYGDTSLEGKNVVLPAIKEVIRTEEVVDQRPKKSYYRRGLGKPQKERILDDVDEEDEDQEEWELAPGVLRAEVMQWDPVTQRGVEDNIEDVGQYPLIFAFLPLYAANSTCRTRPCACRTASHDSRSQRSRVHVCQNAHPSVLPLWHGRPPSRWC